MRGDFAEGIAVIIFEHVTKRYPGGTVAVDDLSLEVPDGKIMILVGPSGCGKTTTLRMVNRLVEPTGGRILLDGRQARARARELMELVGLDPATRRCC
jgi:osmoprotectant transport system ATP-binding protein